jgi:hypothetical protein
MLFRLQENALVSINPNVPPPACGSTRFRWTMHVALPFPLPVLKCICVEVPTSYGRFELAFHNHFDRRYVNAENPAVPPRVSLVPKLKDGEVDPKPSSGFVIAREHLQSVALFRSLSEYTTADAAFAENAEKVKACFLVLTDKLSEIQKALPFHATWAVYPISLFDVGTIHHSVEHFCPKTNRWEFLASGIAMNAARQLSAPLFVADFEPGKTVHPALDLAYELLAEAQLSLFRRLRRLTVLNSCAAVETMANYVFKARRTAQVSAAGMALALAETTAEEERKKHRTDHRFLLHQGLKGACGRSLCDDYQKDYIRFCDVKEDRHMVAHAGKTVSEEFAKECFELCCRIVKWLGEVNGWDVKPIIPETKNCVPSLKMESRDAHALIPAETEAIRRMFGIVLPARHN